MSPFSSQRGDSDFTGALTFCVCSLGIAFPFIIGILAYITACNLDELDENVPTSLISLATQNADKQPTPSLRHHFYTKPKHRRFSRVGSSIRKEEKENGKPRTSFSDSVKKMNENFITSYNSSFKRRSKTSL
ncbi:Oidioi.mRNA.OKI2018_I69.chr1.g1698.t1.cds [Oikopleura dioica]|uniref:Oidioi.mRNA.OKI2018_I69.chr1.g1698.t1.cds n=1 Tax=Oikopleura dioica TaxID=34765 RepID=A0ABN7STR9_OIKDI|nr:Oidioi.mRNA.OKI2018_I69.chr1.g1698.t1.cds [Oikopleura dioica]